MSEYEEFAPDPQKFEIPELRVFRVLVGPGIPPEIVMAHAVSIIDGGLAFAELRKLSGYIATMTTRAIAPGHWVDLREELIPSIKSSKQSN